MILFIISYYFKNDEYNQSMNLNLLTTSQPRKKNIQRENSCRFSNLQTSRQKMPHLNISKINSSELIPSLFILNYDEKNKSNNQKMTTRQKSHKKNHISCEQILMMSKRKEAYASKSILNQKQLKVKMKKKRNEKVNNQNHYNQIFKITNFNSKGNSQIVFSDKQSTLNKTSFAKTNTFSFQIRQMNPERAAIIIQKNWRGYQTRQLLERYIKEEEIELLKVQRYYKSLNASLTKKYANAQILDKDQRQNSNYSNFSALSSIEYFETKLNNEFQEVKYKSNESYSFQNDNKIENQQVNFEKKNEIPKLNLTNVYNHYAPQQPQLLTQSFNGNQSDQRDKLKINSSIYNFNFLNRECNQSIKNGSADIIFQKLKDIQNLVQKQSKSIKKLLKIQLVSNQITFDDMVQKCNRLKQLNADCEQFLKNVFNEIKEMIAAMSQLSSSARIKDINVNNYQPKSQIFTIAYQEIKQTSEAQNKLSLFISQLIRERNQSFPDYSDLQFLCQIIKINSQKGLKNMLERCFVQLTIDLITQNLSINRIFQLLNKNQYGMDSKTQSKEDKFICRWISEINKWEMGTIQQVTQAMESSSFMITETIKSLTTE